MTTIFGIDCATDPKKVGITKAQWDGGKAVVEETLQGSKGYTSKIAGWIQHAQQSLICMDAPLGWPKRMGEVLPDHEAGDPVGKANKMDQFFSRHTDRFIKGKYKSNPLEVGANLIARTAYKALHDLKMIGSDIPVLTNESGREALTSPASAIEVYPAATLDAHGIKFSGYKGKDGKDARGDILGALSENLDFDGDETNAADNDHILDSMVCVLAGMDYLKGDVICPEEDVVKKEGWIWVKRQ